MAISRAQQLIQSHELDYDARLQAAGMHGVKSADLPARKNVNLQMQEQEEVNKVQKKAEHNVQPPGAPVKNDEDPTTPPKEGTKLKMV
eukprot:CAMPEP_0169422056 /NCGR_PEP_ID=MMETSP1017-20121227/66669_1 /TAXON_ID=342587 /ORGANISM="Karlodinium micrum, Strain CCMP2283" /LENGTH=87 /DNA_ID=CAMNT_0009531479 /DNA_START=66 /DNA_END=325 /DNA_ORIENTATION=+